VTTGIPDVIADPAGVTVSLIAGVEPALDPAVVAAAVARVAGGRAKRRKLAQALTARPAVLTDGLSPAPRVVGDVLIALRKAGATVISPPACAGCGRHLRTLQRRGQNWYCAVCGPRPGRCAACGQERIITSFDRHGQPRCASCPDRDDRDPLAVLVTVVARLDSSLPAEQITAAARRVFSRPAKLRQLAWAVEGEPGLLTGDGARAPIPAVLRFIDELRQAGAEHITRPACPRCQRAVRLYRRVEGQWCCRNCVARSRAQPCSRCGALREPAARDQAGGPLCPHCLITDPANLETCTGCGRTRPVSARAPGGPLCPSCLPAKMMTCAVCGRHTACYLSKTTGEPWCDACKQRWARCSRCGKHAQVRGGTKNQPLCGACTRPDPGFWRCCPGCGQPGRINAGRCARCTVDRRLRELLSGPDGQIRHQFRALYQALAAADRPATVAAWLDKSAAPAVLHSLDARSQLTHQALDELTPRKAADHLRAVLVAIGELPPRDEQLIRLERWAAQVIAARTDPGQQQLLHRYAIWHVLRRLRSRLGGAHATPGQADAARRSIRAAAAILDWLTAHALTLATARQGDLETWLASAQASHRIHAGNFIRWARKHKLTQLDVARHRHRNPVGTGTLAAPRRHAQTRRPRRWPARPPLRPMAGRDQPPHPRPHPGRRRPGAHPARPRAGPAPRAARLPGPAARRDPPGSRSHRRSARLALAVPRRPARPPHQRRPHDRTPAPARHPLWPGPLRRPVPARHRPARRGLGPPARHPHHRRRRLATSLRRGLGRLRR
jgi:hypothetical protein